MTFLSPGRLWLLALVPFLVGAYLLMQARRRQAAVRFSNLALLAQIAPRRPGWRRHLAATLFLLSVILMTVGFARPAKPVKVPRERATIIVAIDVSLSMKATDVLPTRLDAAKAAARKFVQDLPMRFNVGLVSFSGNASAVVAPTFDREAVGHAIDGLQLGKGTAIGEAVFTSLQSIRSFDARATQDPPPSHIVLLSDGDNQSGRSVTEAAAAARAAKVPVSTIAFGTPYGTVDIDGETVPVQVNKTTLRNLAHDTAGKAYEAQAGSELSEVYRHIGSSLGYRIERQEAASQYIFAALLLALAAGGLSLVWFQRLP
ncbi:VWA domain-containing protein [Actinoallomurus soli]|uniref:VWA domain-containing protein n=1 Tax=Actinoallomurus soli TaxID=2952535 RepID=UPI00209385CF|nr:VWA domain-containing protein [Actinoallomurus soli]MCO5972321.1 VWA domain-containing protein [Actinoallomurus soli]